MINLTQHSRFLSHSWFVLSLNFSIMIDGELSIRNDVKTEMYFFFFFFFYREDSINIAQNIRKKEKKKEKNVNMKRKEEKKYSTWSRLQKMAERRRKKRV